MSSPFNIDKSLERAEKRLKKKAIPKRSIRSDKGTFRIHQEVINRLRRLISGDEYPKISTIINSLNTFCNKKELPFPGRATVYKFINQVTIHSFKMKQLPSHVQSALYNQTSDNVIPGGQIVFYCLNYGDLAAIQFAAGLPWHCLYQAYRMRGWRPKSYGLLRGILMARDFTHV